MGHAQRSSCDLVGELVVAIGMRDNAGGWPACKEDESFNHLESGSTREGTWNVLARGDLEELPLPPRLVMARPPISLPLAPPLAPPPYASTPIVWTFKLEILAIPFQEKFLSNSVNWVSISAIYIFMEWTTIRASAQLLSMSSARLQSIFFTIQNSWGLWFTHKETLIVWALEH